MHAALLVISCKINRAYSFKPDLLHHYARAITMQCLMHYKHCKATAGLVMDICEITNSVVFAGDIVSSDQVCLVCYTTRGSTIN